MNRAADPGKSPVEDPVKISDIAPPSREKKPRHLLPFLERGELSAERQSELAEWLEQDPQLAATFARWQRRWDGLELPPVAAAPLGFAVRVAAQVRSRSEGELSWSCAPRWARLAAAAALVVGTLGGVSFGLWQSESVQLGELANHGSLAEDYWLIIDTAQAEEGVDGGEALR